MKHLRRSICHALALLAAGVTLAGQQPGGAFLIERPILSSGPGPQRLAIDVPLVTRGQPMTRVYSIGRDEWRADGGLADLRIFDAQRREVPYLLMHASRVPEWATAVVLPQPVTKKTSGFEADLGSVRDVDMVLVEGLPAPFLKRLQLEGSGDRRHWTVLAGEGTLFDLPQERLRQLSLPFAAGGFRYIRVTWDDTNSGRLPLPVAVTARIALEPRIARQTLTAAVAVEPRPSEPGRSRYRIKLPTARLPVVAVKLDVGPGHVFRSASISEARFEHSQASPIVLGRETLARVERDGIVAAALRIRITQPREADLELVIEDGNNAPLDVKSAAIELAELPWIYFEAPPGPLTAHYGRLSTATAPAYDLEAVRTGVKLGALPEARWGEVRELPPTSTAQVSALPDTGAPLDAGGFRYRRPVPTTPGRLTALPLDPAALAHSRGPASAFADLRIGDGSGKQVPYLLERRDEPQMVALTLRPATSTLEALRSAPGHNRSVYQVTLPYAGLPSPRLVLETSERVFERDLQVVAERPPDRRHRDKWIDIVATTVWQHASPDVPPPAVVMPLSVADTRELLLVIDEGDNRPLSIARAQLLLPSWRVRFFSPSTPIALLYGHDGLPPPRYDLALLAPQVMGAEAREVEAAPEPPAASAAAPAFVTPRMFWVGLGVAVLALLAVIAKLVVTSPEAPSPRSPPGP